MFEKTIIRCVAFIEMEADEYESQDILNKIIGKSTPLDDKITIRVEEILTITTFPEKHKEVNEKEVTPNARTTNREPII